MSGQPEPTYTPPKLEISVGRYEVTWEAEKLLLVFERERVDRHRQELSSELTVWDAGDGARILSGARVLMTSSASRATLAKNLEATQQRGDWPGIVEVSLQMARDAMRSGQPGMLLRDAERRESKYLTEPLLIESGATIIFGHGGLGKSLLALAAGIDLHRGDGRILGLQPVAARRVLFLDWEWHESVHRERMEAMVDGDELPDIAYLRCEASITDELERIQENVRQFRSEFLIVDSAAWAAGAEPESSDSAKGFYNALRRIGLPALVNAHQPKAGDPTMPFGSVFWHNGTRLSWQLTAEQDIGETTRRIGLVCRKPNESGPYPRPLGWEVRQDDGRTTYRRVHAAGIASVAAKLPVREQAIAHLVGEPRPQTYAEIAEAVGGNVGSVRRIIDRDLAEKGERSRFVKVTGTDNVYRIALRARESAA